MDFRTAKPIGRDIKADFPALKYGKGYDNCWVLDGVPGLKLAAELSSAASRSGPTSRPPRSTPATGSTARP